MSRAPFRTVALATAVAAMLVLGAVGPVAAGTIDRATSAERYAHQLLDCTRTGGFVTRKGNCRGYGTGSYSVKRPPLRLHRGISGKVAWPWARTMVALNTCAHEITGKPTLSQRLRRKGFDHWYYGENIGCGWGTSDAKAVVLAIHRQMQAEKRYGGGHWKNIKDPGYKSVGIGVAKGNGRVMVVWDFYGRRY